MWAGLSGWHLLLVLAVILLLFGATKLPALARSVGQSARVLKGEIRAMKDEDAARADTLARGDASETSRADSARGAARPDEG